VLQRALHGRLHRRGVPTPMVSAMPQWSTPMPFISAPPALHLVGADLALVGAAQRAGHGAAHLHAGRVRGGHHRRGSARCSRRCEQLMLRWLKASLAAPNTTTSSGHWRGGQRGFQALHVGREHRVAHARLALDAGHDLGVVGHLRHPLGADEAGDLDLAQPAACRRWTSSILCAAATGWASFCRPSRGPTSTSEGFSIRGGPPPGNGLAAFQCPDLAGDLFQAVARQRLRRGVGRDLMRGMLPERVARRQRLGIEHVQRGAGQVAAVQQASRSCSTSMRAARR
jgi:hypothetical protein